MVATMTRYTVRYTRDAAGWWVASVPKVRGCHTQGRTLEEARRRIREALGLAVANADAAVLVDDVRLPREIRRTMAQSRTARTRAERAQQDAEAATTAAVRLLRRRLKMSVRDAGALLGLSHQRVHQLG
jgi:predicted RNase H-like HicB family nuclease